MTNPSESPDRVARNLRLMKEGDDAFNRRDQAHFAAAHHPNMAAPVTGGFAPMVWLAREQALSLVLLAAVTAGYTHPGRLGRRGLRTSIEALKQAAEGQPGSAYRPSAALFESIERQLETDAGTLHDGQLALRDLQRIDEIIAEFAAHEAVEIIEERPGDRGLRPISAARPTLAADLRRVGACHAIAAADGRRRPSREKAVHATPRKPGRGVASGVPAADDGGDLHGHIARTAANVQDAHAGLDPGQPEQPVRGHGENPPWACSRRVSAGAAPSKY